MALVTAVKTTMKKLFHIDPGQAVKIGNASV